MTIDTFGLMSGEDLPIPEWQTIVHQPKLREIAKMGEQKFFLAISYLSVKKDALIKDENILQSINNFQVFMTVLQESKDPQIKESVILLLNLMFPQFKVLFTPSSMILSNEETEQTIIIDGDTFNILQECCDKIFCLKSNSNTNYNPKGKKAQEIMQKIMRGRQRVAAQKSPESAFTKYVSCLAIGQQLSVYDVLEYTLFQLYDQIERYSMYTAWDIDIKSRFAGAKGDSKVKDWMANIH